MSIAALRVLGLVNKLHRYPSIYSSLVNWRRILLSSFLLYSKVMPVATRLDSIKSGGETNGVEPFLGAFLQATSLPYLPLFLGY